jgi:glycine dehydrogenase subunit 2
MTVATQNPMQGDTATTIFEKGAPGRRAFVAPELDVPQVDGLLPDRLRRAEPARRP